MKIKFIIPTVGDGGNEITSSFLLRITNRQKDKYRFLYTSSLDKVATSKNRKKLGLLATDKIPTSQEMRDSKVFKYTSKSLNTFGEHCINCPSVTMNNVSSGVDPVLRTVSREIEKRLFPTKDWDRDKEDFMNSITFKYFDVVVILFNELDTKSLNFSFRDLNHARIIIFSMQNNPVCQE